MARFNTTETEIQNIESELLPEPDFELDILVNKETVCDKDVLQRLLQYSLADAKFEEEYMAFCSDVQPLTAKERSNLFTFMSKYVENEHITDDILNSLPNFERFLLGQLPCKYAPILGSAGTGKTTATANMMIRSNTMTVCGATNPAFGNYMMELQQNVKPGAYNKISKETIYKLTNIKYGEPFIKICLKNLSTDKQLHDSFLNLVTYSTSTRKKKEIKVLLCEHMKVVLRALHPLLYWTVNHLKLSFQPQYRLEITDEHHPYYQPDWEVFDFIKQKKRGKYAISCSNACHAVKSIHGYQALVMMQCSEQSISSSNKNLLPNVMTLVNTIVVDEAGRLPAYFSTLTSFLWWYLQFVYNTPFLYETIPTISPSGSDSQSNVIDFPVSMLDEAICPALIWDKTAVLPYKSEHNRRKINAFSDLKASMHNAACLSLENFQINDFTYKPFMFSETFPELLKDPRIKPNAIRMFPFHQNCDEFIQAMHIHGNADIETRDNIFVSSDITIAYHFDFDHASINDEYLSLLSEEEACKNRLKMWKAKKEIYANGYTVSNNQYKAKVMCSALISCDTGFNCDIENVLQNTYASVQANGLTSNGIGRKYQNMTEKELEDVQYREYMRETYENLTSDFSDQKHDIRFICGPASTMLSKEEHRIKRLHANGIADELGDGTELSKHYYSASIAQGQKPKMQYDPKYDICIEIADPDYSGDDKLLQESICKTVNARTLYMCISRKRYFAENTSVVSGIHKTSLTLCGVNATINTLVYSECFGSAHITFRLLVYCGILEEYRAWIYNIILKGTNIDIFSMEQDQIKNIGNEINVPSRERDIIKKFEEILSLSCDKSSMDFKHKNPDNDKVLLNVSELHDSFKRLVMKSLHLSDQFGEYKLQYLIRNCTLTKHWTFLLQSATKPFYIDKTQCCSHGDLMVFSEGDLNHSNFNRTKRDWEQNMIGKKTIFSIINKTVHDIFPDLVAQTSLKLLLKGALIANTYPTILLQNVRLFNILNKKSNLYGLMMRLNAASLSQRTDMLMHKIFAVNGGECMNFPRPFLVGGTDKWSNIVLKCRDNILHFSSQREKSNETIPTKKIESFSVLPLMNPLFSEVASTVDSMQGKTMSGQSMVDLNNMSSSKQLVAVTRNNSSHNLYTSNVLAAMQRKMDTSVNIAIKQKTRAIASAYFKYR